MKINKQAVHVLGTILVLSTLYHSYTLYSLFVVLPLALVSYSIQTEKKSLLFPSLIIATILPCFFIAGKSLDNIFSLIFFSITFAIPFFLYWLVSFLDKSRIEWRPVTIALIYILITTFLFYTILEFFGVSEFIFSPENTGPQTLLFFGSAIIVAVPFHVMLEIKG